MKKLAVIFSSLMLLAGTVSASEGTPPSAEQSDSMSQVDTKAISVALHKVHLNANSIRAISPMLVEIEVNGETIYATADGQYLLFGQVISIADGKVKNLTQDALFKSVDDMLSKGEAITYKAEHEQAEITVFTDYTCGYCRKLHMHLQEMLAAGVTVHYLPWPRSGAGSPHADVMQNAWCSKDQKAAIDSLFNGQPIPQAKCDSDLVNRAFEAGKKLGIQGTPAIVFPGHRMDVGYKTMDELTQILGLQSK